MKPVPRRYLLFPAAIGLALAMVLVRLAQIQLPHHEVPGRAAITRSHSGKQSGLAILASKGLSKVRRLLRRIHFVG